MSYYDKLADGVTKIITAYGKKTDSGKAILILSKSDECFVAIKDIVRFLRSAGMEDQAFDARRLASQEIEILADIELRSEFDAASQAPFSEYRK